MDNRLACYAGKVREGRGGEGERRGGDRKGREEEGRGGVTVCMALGWVCMCT